MSTQITDQNFKEEIPKQSTDKPLVIDFFAHWCGPCKVLSPKIDELKKEYQGKVNIVKIDVDEHPEIASEYGIRSIPTILFFKDGKKVGEPIMGNNPKEIKNKIEEMVN